MKTLERVERIGSHIIDGFMVFVALVAIIPISIGLLMSELFLLMFFNRIEFSVSSEVWNVIGVGIVCLVIVCYCLFILTMLRVGDIFKRVYHKYIKGAKNYETKKGINELQEVDKGNLGLGS